MGEIAWQTRQGCAVQNAIAWPQHDTTYFCRHGEDATGIDCINTDTATPNTIYIDGEGTVCSHAAYCALGKFGLLPHQFPPDAFCDGAGVANTPGAG
ncbi:MAG: hypothetical protein ABWY71_03440 [Candidatus Saccharimonadales bacterium]